MTAISRLYTALGARGSLALILMLGVVLRLAAASHPWGTDDLNYAFAAHTESNHFFELPDDGHVQTHHDLRKGLILPAAVLYALFGVNAWTTGAWPFLCSMGLVFLAHRFGRMFLKSEPAALFVALLAAVFPLDVLFASVLWPTTPQAFFMGWGVYLFLRAEQSERPRARAYLLAGLVIGAAYLVHITAMFLVFFFIAYFACWPRRIRLPVFLVAAGVLIVVGLESLAYYPFHHEWLYPLKQIDRSQNMGLGWGYIRNWEGYSSLLEGSGIGTSFVLSPWVMLFVNHEFGAYYLFGLPALAWAAVKRPELRVVIVWFAALFLWTAYGTTTPSMWMWLGRMPRYYAPVTLPLILAIGAAVLALHRRGRPKLALTVGSLTVLSGLVGVALEDGTNTWHAEMLAREVVAHPEQRFATDHQTFGQARYYAGFAPLSNLRVITAPPEQGGLYHGADIRPWDGEGIDRFFEYPTNWDLAVRQPENCGSRDKTGGLREDCPAEALMTEVRGWTAEPPLVHAGRLACTPLGWVSGIGPFARIHARLCGNGETARFYDRPASLEP